MNLGNIEKCIIFLNIRLNTYKKKIEGAGFIV